jgi:hypothetical protein
MKAVTGKDMLWIGAGMLFGAMLFLYFCVIRSLQP